MDLVVKGADELGVLAKRIKEVGDKELRKELLRGIREGTKGTKAAVKASALANLPSRGGLAGRIAASKFATKTRTTAKVTSVRITAANQHSIAGMDRGKLRHRVFGGDKWVSQSVKPGWFSDPIEADAPKVRAQIQQSMSNIAAKLGN